MNQTVAVSSTAPPLFVIAADLALAPIEAIVSAKDSSEIKVGAKAMVTIEAFPGRQFSGTVTQIRPLTQTYGQAAATDVVISAPNPDLLLKPGMAATIRIVKE